MGILDALRRKGDANMGISVVVTRANGKVEKKGIVSKGKSLWKASAG